MSWPLSAASEAATFIQREKWAVRISLDETLTALQVSHFNNTACLNVFLSSFPNSYVHKLPTERRRGERMNERNGGEGGGVGNWDMKERRENKSPSEEDDASWLEKQQGILSLSSLIFVFLSSLFFFSRSVNSLCSAEI